MIKFITHNAKIETVKNNIYVELPDNTVFHKDSFKHGSTLKMIEHAILNLISDEDRDILVQKLLQEIER